MNEVYINWNTNHSLRYGDRRKQASNCFRGRYTMLAPAGNGGGKVPRWKNVLATINTNLFMFSLPALEVGSYS